MVDVDFLSRSSTYFNLKNGIIYLMYQLQIIFETMLTHGGTATQPGPSRPGLLQMEGENLWIKVGVLSGLVFFMIG